MVAGLRGLAVAIGGLLLRGLGGVHGEVGGALGRGRVENTICNRFCNVAIEDFLRFSKLFDHFNTFTHSHEHVQVAHRLKCINLCEFRMESRIRSILTLNQ